MRIGLVGYGTGGRHFHAPFIAAAEGVELAGVVARAHASGVHSHVSASKLNRIIAKEYRAYGETGSYVSSGTDVQAQAIFGRRPADDLVSWGYESEEHRGTLPTVAGEERVPSEQGRYHDYYEGFARAIRDGTAPPATAEEATRTLAVLDAARKSAAEGRSVEVEPTRK